MPYTFEEEDLRARALLRELNNPAPPYYWTDLLLSALTGWTAVGFAATRPLFSLPMLIAFTIAVAAIYRALCFIHEISHIRRNALRGFEWTWNVLIGFPALMPSFIYDGVHQAHHSLSSYGTVRDPEYLPFAQSRVMTTLFALESFLIPAGLALRFLVAAPAGLVIPPFQRWLAAHASSLTINFAFRREVTAALLARMRRDTLIIVIIWATAIVLLPWNFFAVWFAVLSAVSFVNTLRTLVAHRYESDGAAVDRRGQLRDSIDVPGKMWTELWAPVGLRYHALHHYFPGIPYHNLAEAHRRLVDALPPESVYRAASNSGLIRSLRILLAAKDRRARALATKQTSAGD